MTKLLIEVINFFKVKNMLWLRTEDKSQLTKQLVVPKLPDCFYVSEQKPELRTYLFVPVSVTDAD